MGWCRLSTLGPDLLARGLPVRFIARGQSMRPALRDGDRLILDADTTTVTVGDVVALPDRPFAVCHRVIARIGEQVLVKGDAVGWPDGWYARDALLARVVGVERAGLPQPIRSLTAVPRSVVGALPRIGRDLLDRRLRRP